MRHPAIPIIGFLILVCSAGAVHGIWTDRWKPSQALQEALAQLEHVPTAFGDWTSNDNEIEPEAMASAGIRGHVFRTYRHSRNGTVVSVLLVCGQGGPICVHTPDVCYAGSGYQIAAGQQRLTISDGIEFWTCQFNKTDALVPERLQFFWSWSTNLEKWRAPDNPRWNLARHSAVFKLYVVRNIAQKAKNDDAPVRDFLSLFLSELEKSVTATASQTHPVNGPNTD